MHRVPSLRVTWLSLLAYLVVGLALPAPAWAGTLAVRDDSHVLTPEATTRLRAVVGAEPFDARLVFTSEYADAQEFSRYVGTLVREPDMIAVGVDPRHRHVEVHFGTGSGIARSDWPAVERAGNESFQAGDWEGGATAIFKAAARTATGAPLGVTPGTPAAQPSRIGSGVVLFLLIVGVIGLFAFLGRRRQAVSGGYGSGYGSGYGPGYGGPGYGGPGYGGPYGAPPPAGGMGPLGGGLIGAGLGGIAGYELGKMEGEREERDRERVIEEERPAPDDDYDAGGGGSSWGDDGGGGGGGDSGGGSDF